MTLIRSVARIFAPGAVAVLFGTTIGSLGAEEVRFGLPVDCAIGTQCFVQNYVDLDPEEGVLDATCGAATYDGHKGTDFRVLTTKDVVEVISVASGVVKRVRNEMPDRLVLNKKDRSRVAGRECGNGAVIGHEGGWETQYCHLRQGSVSVAPGQTVERGEKIGLVGYSGLAAFAHVHLQIFKDGKVIDPFVGRKNLGGDTQHVCNDNQQSETSAESLWQAGVNDLLGDASGRVIEVGFADKPVSTTDLETGAAGDPVKASGALVFFARAINLKKGDRLVLQVSGPGGFESFSEGKPMPRQKAQWVAYTGRKLRGTGWPAGTYSGEVMLVREGRAIQRKVADFELN